MGVITVNRQYTVRPASPTWTGRLSLSELDQTLAYVPTLYFYKPSEQWLTPPDKIVVSLRDSLSRALVHFYSLAGRVAWAPGNRLELRCNAAGARLVEAESDRALADFSDFSPSADFAHLVPSVDYAVPVHEMPLLRVQVTRFRCGGISLGMTMSHAVCDGLGAFKFIGEWARIARGEPITIVPFLDRAVLKAGEPPSGPPKFDHKQFDRAPLLLGEADAEKERNKRTALIMLELNQFQIEELKNAANDGRETDAPGYRPYSKYEAVAAHLWRCMCKARGHAAEQETRVGVCVDFRRRVPRFPDGYFGNAALNVAATGQAGQLVGKPLGYTASIMREAIESVTDEYVWSAIDYLKSEPDLSRFQDLESGDESEERRRRRPFYGNPNLRITSWLTLPIFGKDFGWGKEVHMGLGPQDVDGDSLILPSQLGDGSLVIACCLQLVHADAFKKFFHEDITYKKLVGQHVI